MNENPSSAKDTVDNRISKYLKYAIGEILLVVIGILIALQINNWNQERIIQQENRVILQNLNKEFSENLIELDIAINQLSTVIEGLDQLLTAMRTQDRQFTDSEFDQLLHKSFVTPNWAPSSFVLAELKNSGALSKLDNNNLKTLLFKWEREFYSMKETTNEGYNQYTGDYIEFLTKNGSVRNLDALTESSKGLQKSTIARNDPELLKNPEFENRADNFYFLAAALKANFQSLRIIMTNIIDASNTESKQ